MRNRLLINPGTEQAWEISLKPGVNRVGRSEDNDFTINHTSISTHHCELTVSDAGVMLKDLGSTNGTFVNGAPVREVWLQNGQHVQIGAIATTFEADQPAGASSPSGQPAPGATVVMADVGAPSGIRPPATSALRISRQETATESAPAAESPGEASPSRPVGRPGRFPVHQVAEREAAGKKRFLLGAVGAALGGLIGATVWYFLIKSTGSAFALVAWGVGVVTGLGARLLSKQGNMALGVVAGVCALVAIVAGEYLAVKAIVTREGTKIANIAYLGQMEYAREAVKLETPEQIRAFIAKENEKAETDITDAELKEFQDHEIPAMRDFVRGKPSRAEFAKTLGVRFADEFDYKEHFFKEDVKSGLFMVLFAVLGIASAYKIASGEDDD